MQPTLTTAQRQADIASIARALTDRADTIGPALLGKPTSRAKHEFRWGRKGSLSLSLAGVKRGLWCDHERGEGGDLLDLIARERGVRLKEAIGIAEQFLGGAVAVAERPQPVKPVEDDSAARAESARRLWAETVPIGGTLAERYLVERRGLAVGQLDLSHVLRWHGRIRAVVARMSDPVSGEGSGVHRTFLDANGAKVKPKMLGRQGVVRLSPDDAVTMGLGITEGVEDGLAVLLSGWAPVWAATSSGAIARFPVLAGVETLTVLADADDAGIHAAETCAARWQAAGRQVEIASPKEGA